MRCSTLLLLIFFNILDNVFHNLYGNDFQVVCHEEEKNQMLGNEPTDMFEFKGKNGNANNFILHYHFIFLVYWIFFACNFKRKINENLGLKLTNHIRNQNCHYKIYILNCKRFRRLNETKPKKTKIQIQNL